MMLRHTCSENMMEREFNKYASKSHLAWMVRFSVAKGEIRSSTLYWPVQCTHHICLHIRPDSPHKLAMHKKIFHHNNCFGAHSFLNGNLLPLPSPPSSICVCVSPLVFTVCCLLLHLAILSNGRRTKTHTQS